MNNNIFKIFIFALILIISISCGKTGNKEAEVKPLKTEIKGEIGNYLKIVDEKYKVVPSQESMDDWTITFKLVNYNTGYLDENSEIDFKLMLTDNSGKPINGMKEFWMSDGLWGTADELEKLKRLIQEKPGSEEWFTLNMDQDYGSDFEEKLPEGVTHFVINTIVKPKENQESSSSSFESNSQEDSEISTESSNNDYGSQNWDEILDSYENYIDQYIRLLKKAQNGDIDALSEYPSFMERAADLAEKLQNAENDLSSSQMSRFIELQSKLSKAALEF